MNAKNVYFNTMIKASLIAWLVFNRD